MKIMHILCTGTYSGAENMAISIIEQMKDKDHTGVYVSPSGIIDEKLYENNIEHFIIKKVCVKEIKRAIRTIKPDIIHAHDFKASVIATLTLTQIPIISHLHNNSNWIKKFNFKSLVYLLCSRRVKKILLVSKSIKEEYIYSNMISDKMIVMGNFVDLKNVRYKANEGNMKEKFDVIFLGRLSLEKNPEKFLGVIKLVKDKLPNINAAMVGDGSLKTKCEDIIKENCLENNVELFGFLDNPYTILNNSKILCITSNWEGFGLVAVEAFALNIPVVASDVGGLPDIVDDYCGKICKSNKDFCEEIVKLLKDFKYYEKKVSNIPQKLSKINNTAKYIENLDNIYREISNEVK